LTTLENPSFPFFVEWISDSHPSKSSLPVASISELTISGDQKKVESWVGKNELLVIDDIKINWCDENQELDSGGLLEVNFIFNNHKISID